MMFVNLALENERNMDFPMPIVKTTYFSQYQWKIVLDLSVDMPNVEKFEPFAKTISCHHDFQSNFTHVGVK